MTEIGEYSERVSMHKRNKYNIGDMVRVIDCNKMNKWMEPMLGKEVVIEDFCIDSYGDWWYCLAGNGRAWREKWLELVEHRNYTERREAIDSML